MKYEHYSDPLLSFHLWLRRVLRSAWVACTVIALALFFGIAGYHFLGALPWIDALLEASMILGGMGPVAPMTNNAVKVFASFYALFSSFIVLTSAAILFAPFLHRLLHHFHLQNSKK